MEKPVAKALKIVKHFPLTKEELLEREMKTLVNQKKRNKKGSESVENEASANVKAHRRIM